MSLTDTQINYIFYVFCGVAPVSVLGSSVTLLTIYRTRKIMRQGGRSRSNNNTRRPPYDRSESQSIRGSVTTTTTSGSTTPMSGSTITRSSRSRKTNINNKNELTTFHRLMMGISIFDIFFSGALMFGPLPMPSYLGYPGAHGNMQTCTAQAFFTQLGMASFCYSQMLMLYFFLVIRYNVRDTMLRRRYEPFMHGVPILFYVGTAIAGLFMEIYGPSGNTCWVGTYPPFCNDDDIGLDCERGGEHERLFGLGFVTIPFYIWTFLIIFWLLLVVATVIQKHLQSRQFVFRGSTSTTETLPPPEAATGAAATAAEASPGGGRNRSSSHTRRSAAERQLQRVIVQCFLYAFWFITMSLFATLDVLFGETGREYRSAKTQFWFLAFALFLLPLAGLVNFLIYIRPSYIDIRRKHTHCRRLWALREAIWFPGCLEQDRRCRLMSLGQGSSSHLNMSMTSNTSPSFRRTNTDNDITYEETETGLRLDENEEELAPSTVDERQHDEAEKLPTNGVAPASMTSDTDPNDDDDDEEVKEPNVLSPSQTKDVGVNTEPSTASDQC